MADRDSRSLSMASKLYRELKRKEALKEPTVIADPAERRRRAQERLKAIRQTIKENLERRSVPTTCSCACDV